MLALLTAASANGDGAAQPLTGAFPMTAEFLAWGTFGGGTVKLQQSPDGGTTWLDFDSLTAAGRKVVTLTHSSKVRASLSGATGPNITAKLAGVNGVTVTSL